MNSEEAEIANICTQELFFGFIVKQFISGFAICSNNGVYIYIYIYKYIYIYI